MCNFFSFCSNGKDYLYTDWAERIRLRHDGVDSHSSILTRAGIPAGRQAAWSCYEYNPLTKAFAVDRAVEGHDTEAARNWVEARDWKTIVEPLLIKPIVNPFARRAPKVTSKHIALLKKWYSVGDSVEASVGDSVGYSVWHSVGDSVGYSVWHSVGDSVRASVGASVWASVRAYISSFFAIKYEYDFTPVVLLWEAGIVPSFDGKTWRLHGGKNAKVLHEWTPRRSSDG